MLKFYLSTIVIWYIIIFASTKITMPLIKKNEWIEIEKKGGKIKGLFGCLLISAIPVFRLIVTISLFILSFNKKEGH